MDIFEALKAGQEVDMYSEAYRPCVEELHRTDRALFHTITNPGAVDSEPLIRVYGNGDITLMVGTQIVELEGIDGQIFLDSEIQEAYKGTTSMNVAMSGEFPKLLPGMNAVSRTGNVTSIVITPRWRTL